MILTRGEDDKGQERRKEKIKKEGENSNPFSACWKRRIRIVSLWGKG